MEPEKQMLESNPIVDVATLLFLEDIADKQGAGGLNNYLMSLARNLARTMPEEEYKTWDDFLEALRRSESILSTFEEVFTPTKHCVVTRHCPFEKAWAEYVRRIGSVARIHKEVAEYYNATVKPGALNSLEIIHQTFRAAATDRIRVGGKKVKYAQIASVWSDGERRTVPDEWKPILLERAGISDTQLNMFLRNNADVWVVYTE